MFDFNTFSFITRQAWGVPDVRLFSFHNIKLKDIVKDDGRYVVSFDCDNLAVNIDLTEKYRLAEVDKKYEEGAINDGVVVDIETASRNSNKKGIENGENCG